MLDTTKATASTLPERMAFSVNDASHQLSIGRSTLYALIRDGEVRTIKIAGRTLIPRTELERLISLDKKAAA